MKESVWILYDGRADFLPTEECAVYTVEGSEADARRALDDWPDDTCVFRYDVGDDGVAINERRVQLSAQKGGDRG